MKRLTTRNTRAQNVKIVTTEFAIPQLGRTRRLWVYLPVDYYETDNYYPVIYMHDGQNLFDRTANSLGLEWNVDEHLNRMAEEGDPGVIVVGIDHGEQERIDELSPWKRAKIGGGKGDAYAVFIVDTLKPFIDHHFRTRPGREHTAIMGSSLGGLLTLYAAIKYQYVFSKAGVFSPSLWFSEKIYTYIRQQCRQKPMRLYLLAGGQEQQSMSARMDALVSALQKAGFPDEEIHYKYVEKGQHSETFWSEEFPEAYSWLFEEAPRTDARSLIVFPDPASEFVHVMLSEPVSFGKVELVASDGEVMISCEYDPKSPIAVQALPGGEYTARLSVKEAVFEKVFEVAKGEG